MQNRLEIKLSGMQYHLYHGGWKIHHILSDEIFKSSQWNGIKICSEDPNHGSIASDGGEIVTQDIEIIPANPSDIHYWRILVDKKLVSEQRRFSEKGNGMLRDLIRNEGLTTYEFHQKFNLHSDKVKYFSGKIIHFGGFMYHMPPDQNK